MTSDIRHHTYYAVVNRFLFKGEACNLMAKNSFGKLSISLIQVWQEEKPSFELSHKGHDILLVNSSRVW